MEAQQKAEVARKHEMRLLQKNQLRTGIRRNPLISPNIVNSNKAKLNIEKKAEDKVISESEKYIIIYIISSKEKSKV